MSFCIFNAFDIFISFCCGGTAPIEKKIDSLISNAPKESPIMEFQKQLENEKLQILKIRKLIIIKIKILV